MHKRRTKLAILGIAFAVLLMTVILQYKARSLVQVAPTVNVRAIQTEAVATFAESLTRTSRVQRTTTIATSSRTEATNSLLGTGTPTASCLSLRFVRDVTIPDNTEMTPAQVFTKTWLVENDGSCPWQPDYKVVLIGGVAMGGSPFKVSKTVGPGGTIQVSIKMASPTNLTGVVEGSWMMSDESGAVFGDYLTIVIVVNRSSRTPPAAASTSTP